MPTLHYDELRKQAQLESWQRSEEQNVPLGYGLANAVEGGIQRGVGWLQEQAEDDPDTWTDDALRLMGGGLKNISKIPGMSLLAKVGETGGGIGAGIAEMMGVDRRIGGFVGEMATDSLLGFGAGKVARTAKAARSINRLKKFNPLYTGELIKAGPGAVRGYSGGVLDDITTAAKSSTQTQKNLIKADKTTRLLNEAGDWSIGSGRAARALLREETAKWLVEERRLAGGDINKIDRTKFGKVFIGGEERGISGIHRFFEAYDKAGGDLTKLTGKTKTKKSDWFEFVGKKHAEARKLLETPPYEEMNAWALRHNVEPEVMKEYFRFAKAGFANVQEAAARMNKFDKMPRKWHAGHLTAAATDVPNDAQWLWRSKNSRMGLPPTTGGHATIVELGADNIAHLNKIEGNINPFAARIADIPLSWEQDLKRFLRIKNGQRHGNYAADWTIAERKIIESIPYNAKKKDVERIFAELYAKQRSNPNHWTHQEKAWMRELRIEKARGPEPSDYYDNFLDDPGFIEGTAKGRGRKKLKIQEVSTADWIKATEETLRSLRSKVKKAKPESVDLAALKSKLIAEEIALERVRNEIRQGIRPAPTAQWGTFNVNTMSML